MGVLTETSPSGLRTKVRLPGECTRLQAHLFTTRMSVATVRQPEAGLPAVQKNTQLIIGVQKSLKKKLRLD